MPEQRTLTRLEKLAWEMEVDAGELRWWIRELVDQRSRARAAKHARAHGQIDAKAGLNGR